MARTLLARLHNPRAQRCGCPPECICQRSEIGRALRWYIPGRYHTPLSGDEKRARAADEGRSFRAE
jgi:hypothetical protein